jgi:tRNA(fMet)-specific endonuclease VapC
MKEHAFQYLLDANIVSDLIRTPDGAIAKRIAKVGEALVCTSILVAAELRFGAAKRGSNQLSARVELVLSLLPVLAFDVGMDATYATIRLALETAGLPIGGNDLQIAAQARSLKLTLVTANIREFQRVPKLKVENWL